MGFFMISKVKPFYLIRIIFLVSEKLLPESL